MKKPTLKEQLWQAVNEYTWQVAELLECNHSDCHWVGTDDKGNGTFTICDFGDTTFLTLDQMQTIIDRLPEWEKRYGSRRAVAEEVCEWLEWSLEEQNLTDGHPRINLEHWLMGCPREKPEPTIYDATRCGMVQGIQENRSLQGIRECNKREHRLKGYFLQRIKRIKRIIFINQLKLNHYDKE